MMRLIDLVWRLYDPLEHYDRHGYVCECWQCHIIDFLLEWQGQRVLDA